MFTFHIHCSKKACIFPQSIESNSVSVHNWIVVWCKHLPDMCGCNIFGNLFNFLCMCTVYPIFELIRKLKANVIRKVCYIIKITFDVVCMFWPELFSSYLLTIVFLNVGCVLVFYVFLGCSVWVFCIQAIWSWCP